MKVVGFASVDASVETRFWRYAVVQEDGCWGWAASLMGEGYAQLKVDSRPVGAHRVSWEIHNGPIPEGLCVLHTCDNRPCTRPDHLFLGTNEDNINDMISKGRQRHDEAGRFAEMTP